MSFQEQFKVKWADVDPYMHLRNTVYVDFADQTRVAYFHSRGYDFKRFIQEGYGPVILKVTSTYLKEVVLHEAISIDCKAAYIAEDSTRWIIVHQVFKENGSLAATIRVEGGFLDLSKRKLTAPHQDVKDIMAAMDKTDDVL